MLGTRKAVISCSEQQDFLLLWAMPKKDPMGVFSVLRDTKWEKLIGKVSGENLSHALHGWATPLVRELPSKPKSLLRTLKNERCWMQKECVMATDRCYPNLKVPNCFEPEDPQVRAVVNFILNMMRDGYRIVWVDGAEFSM